MCYCGCSEDKKSPQLLEVMYSIADETGFTVKSFLDIGVWGAVVGGEEGTLADVLRVRGLSDGCCGLSFALSSVHLRIFLIKSFSMT